MRVDGVDKAAVECAALTTRDWSGDSDKPSLFTDGYANRHYVRYGPAGQLPPTHVAGVPSSATVVIYEPAKLFPNGAILTLR